MGFRLYRRFKILPSIRLNFSRSGVSASGAHITVGHGKLRETVGLPGTGVSYMHVQGMPQEALSEAQAAGVADPLPKGRAWRGWIWIALVVAILAALIFAAGCVSAGIVKAGGDTYIASNTGSMLPSSSPPSSQAAYALKRATEFCEKRNEAVEVVNLEGRGRSSTQPASARLQFRCVDRKNDSH
jgi:Protein of unknown function (DUF4236)